MDADKSVTATFASSGSSIDGTWEGRVYTQATEGYCPAQTVTWRATIHVGNGTLTGTWYDSYHNQTLPLNATFDGANAQWSVSSGDDQIVITATFSGTSVSGSTLGPVCWKQKIKGTLQGNRIGS
jgi:hypothetical protein